MYPILILRCELICIVMLAFLFFTSRIYKIDNNRNFNRILLYAFVHVIFDIITVITVNHTDTVPSSVNWICHVAFYITAILYAVEIASYVVKICYPRMERKLSGVGNALLFIYICCLPSMEIIYLPDKGTWSSAGSAAVVGYGLAFLLFVFSLIIIFINLNNLPAAFRHTMIPMMFVLLIAGVCQMIWKSLLFTGGAITIVTVGVFFSLENPIEVFKQKAMTDALTGVRSRSSYEADIEKYDKLFRKEPRDDYIFAFCDLNDLRSVNNRLGHAEGDNYITLIASSINEYMKNSTAVYRIGGDEFLILYYQVSIDTVEGEIHALQEACVEASKNLPYKAMVSVGYARSSPSYESLLDVVKTADYEMYQNKAKLKNGQKGNDLSLGTTLNYAGLTDHIFDVMSSANGSTYPFITNLSTNVTRISPAWKDYFGLESEFYGDFVAMWKERIHPDDFDGYIADIIAVLNGHKKYHKYDYRAKKANGEYVSVTCQGSVYHDSGDGCDFFSGFIVNHAPDAGNEPGE